MTQQLSSCCKAAIDFNPKLDRPECYKCIECGRIIGSPVQGKTRKTYLVETYSNVKGTRRIKALGPEEAKAIVDVEMKESLERLIRTTVLHEDITQISGSAGTQGEVYEEF